MSQTIKEFLIKNGLYILLIGFLAVVVAGFFKERNKNKRLFTELIGQTQKYEQLSEHAAKLEIKYVGQEKLRAELEKQFAAEKDALKGRIKVLSNATFLIRDKARRSNNSDVVYKGKRVKYVLNEIRYNDGPPIGYVLIFDDGRVTSKIYNHKIEVKTAISRDEANGRYNIVSKADYVLKSPHYMKPGSKNWFNQPYPLKIVGGTAMVDPTEPNTAKKRFHLWAPNLNLGIDLGDSVKPSVGVSLAGYGYSVRDLDWKFLQLGVNYSDEKSFGAHLIPVLYRPFPKILRNTYIGPGLGYDNGSRFLMFGINVGL